jgi:hypothetical protein
VGPRTSLDDVQRRRIFAPTGFELRALDFDFDFTSHNGIVLKKFQIIKKFNCL